MSDTSTPYAAATDAELTHAAALEGLSVEELTARGARIYARKLLAIYDSLPLLHPAPWRQFKIEDGGNTVSFKVRLPLSCFSQAVYIEQRIRKSNGGAYSEDACAIAENHLLARLKDLPAISEKEKKERTRLYLEWLDTQSDLIDRLKAIETEADDD